MSTNPFSNVPDNLDDDSNSPLNSTPQILETYTLDEKVFDYTTANEIVRKKITIGKLSIESLKMQKQVNGLTNEINEMVDRIIDKKIQLAELSNKVLEQQLREFSEIRQLEYKNICDQMEDLDSHNNNVELVEKINSRDEIDHRFVNVVKRIEALSQTIPSEKEFCNIKIKAKQPAE